MMKAIIENWAEILLVVQTIIRITPTKADDKIESKWGKILNNIVLGSVTIKEKK
jgi:hypothetical protein